MSKCIVVQSDFSITLEKNSPSFSNARDLLLKFAELVKCPEHLHTYKISKLSLWNAAALGIKVSDILSELEKYLKYPVPYVVQRDMELNFRLWGLVELVKEKDNYFLIVYEEELLDIILGNNVVNNASFKVQKLKDFTKILIEDNQRGSIKVELIKLGVPVKDIAGFREGREFKIESKVNLRNYQKDALHAFHINDSKLGGSGVIVLPCGAGKTIVGISAISKIKNYTLILAPNTSAIKQWKAELIDKTDVSPEDIGEYSGQIKEIKPITIASYQILTKRKNKVSKFINFDIFNKEKWGLIIYDEVHLLPAPVFKVTANIQATRRLGLTATLVREDGKANEVFSLIGPKRFEMPWKILEDKGWIAKAICTEVSVGLSSELNKEVSFAEKRFKFRLASSNPRKIKVLKDILNIHKSSSVLIIGLYIDQIQEISKELDVPIINGKTKQKDREELFQQFRMGKIKTLVLSKIGNAAIDLPNAEVAVQVSGTFGSRQEEAQRLGRIIRPKKGDNQAFFYTLVSEHPAEEAFATNRQLFLAEQGYEYNFISEKDFSVSLKRAS